MIIVSQKANECLCSVFFFPQTRIVLTRNFVRSSQIRIQITSIPKSKTIQEVKHNTLFKTFEKISNIIHEMLTRALAGTCDVSCYFPYSPLTLVPKCVWLSHNFRSPR